MNRVRLSNYAGDKLQAARERRENEYFAKQKQFEQVRDGIYAQRADAGHAFIDAAMHVAVFSATGSLWDWVVAQAKPLPLAPVCDAPTVAERRLEAGIYGEDLVERHIEAQVDQSRYEYIEDDPRYGYNPILRRVAGTETTSISGYRGRKGEIDLIIVSPWNVVAIEVKYLDGVVYSHGGDWYRDIYDRDGNQRKVGVPIKDKGGRSPGRQLTEAADELDALFLKNGLGFIVSRHVVLAHPNGVVGDIDLRQDRIHGVTNVAHLDLSAPELESEDDFFECGWDANQIAEITEVISADFARFNPPRVH